MLHSTGFLVLACVAIAIQSFLLFLFLFEPCLPYKIKKRPVALQTKQFADLLEVLAGAQMHQHCDVEVLTNGEVYFEAELAAIRKAKKSVNLEAYIFQKGRVTRRLLKALTERAKAGVKINMVLDAIGCFATPNSYFKEFKKVGGRIEWYHPFRWYTLPRLNNRTHRELIIVDGEVGFIGGSGFADHWLYSKGKHRRWRDTMFCVKGEAVKSLQSVFAENWLEASGEILTDKIYFPPLCEGKGNVTTQVVNSSPSAGRSTRARVLYQTLLASARETIYITTPYFLPDRSVRAEFARAVEERGVDLTIITPGKQSDHLLTRRSSRRLYGDLLKVGARIYEYVPSMIHAKIMIVDRMWCVIGSTNFDHRSFGLNDEVNLVACDEELAQRLYLDFQSDLAQSELVSYDDWKKRSIVERVHEWFG